MNNQQLDSLLARYRQNRDPQDIAEVFDLCATSLFSTAMHLLGDAAEAEDAIQDTFVALIKTAHRYDPSRPAMPYIVGVLQRQALYRARRKRRSPDRGRIDLPASVSPSQTAETAESAEALRAAITGLPEAYRRVLNSILEGSLSPAEIAHRSGESPGAIRTRIHRGLAMLRGRLPAGVAVPSMLLMMEGRSLGAVRTAVLEEASRAAQIASAGGSGAGLWIKTKLAGSAAGVKAAAVLGVAVTMGVGATAVQGVCDDSFQEGPGRRNAAAKPSPDGPPAAFGTTSSDPSEDTSNPKREVARDSAMAAPTVRTGDATLQVGEGFSFTKDQIVPRDEADLWFASGQSDPNISLQSRYGVAALPLPYLELDGVPCTLDCYLRSVVSFEDDKVDWQKELETDLFFRPAGVFVARTAGGGFAVCIVEDHGHEQGAEHRLAALRYAYNPSASKFSTEPADVSEQGGIRFDMLAFKSDPMRVTFQAEYERRLGLLRTRMSQLDERAKQLARPLGVANGTTEGVTAVLSWDGGREILGASGRDAGRGYRASYVTSTFSFEAATRDDVGRVGNDWDLHSIGRTGKDLQFHPKSTSGDHGRIWALGPVTFDAIGGPSSVETILSNRVFDREADSKGRVPVEIGSGYLIRTLDADSHLWAAVQVLEVTEDGGVIFRWKTLSEMDTLERAVRLGQRELNPVVRVQMRSGARDGNFNRIFIDGTAGDYLDEVSSVPLDLTVMPECDEPSVAYVEAGVVPPGQVWVVTEIDYSASARGDDNGPGGFAVAFKKGSLIDVPTAADPVRGRWEGRIEVRPGDEARFFVEVRNSSVCDVTIHGRFEPDAAKEDGAK